MARILLIEDERTNQLIVSASLSDHHVSTASTLMEARNFLQTDDIDLILLDVQLPDGDGFSFFMEINSTLQEKEIPLIFLTQRQSPSDKVTGYSLGADDYITKPFDIPEFQARIESKIRKIHAKKSQQSVIRKQGFVFSLEKQTVHYEQAGQSIDLGLTSLEFKLLLYCLKHKDRILSREKLIQEVWGEKVSVSQRSIDTHMSHLRKRLTSTPVTIEAVYGAGYKLTSSQSNGT
jgi:DNA-binding response OmpR family regulator